MAISIAHQIKQLTNTRRSAASEQYRNLVKKYALSEHLPTENELNEISTLISTLGLSEDNLSDDIQAIQKLGQLQTVVDDKANREASAQAARIAFGDYIKQLERERLAQEQKVRDLDAVKSAAVGQVAQSHEAQTEIESIKKQHSHLFVG